MQCFVEEYVHVTRFRRDGDAKANVKIEPVRYTQPDFGTGVDTAPCAESKSVA